MQMSDEPARRIRDGAAPGRPSAEESARTREMILEVALEEFAKHGFDGVSVRDLNRRLGVSHNLIHHHFGAKSKLWQAAVDRGYERSFATIPMPDAAPDERDDIPEALARGLQNFVENCAAHPEVHRIFEHEAGLGGERLDYILERHWLPAIARAQPFFDRLVRTSERRLELRSLVLFLSSGMTSLFRLAPMARQFGGADPFSQDGIEQHARTVIEILLHGLSGTDLEASQGDPGEHRRSLD